MSKTLDKTMAKTPLTLAEIERIAIVPALALLPEHMDSSAARIELFAIGMQESDDFMHRVQMNGGPARGFWQFERAGGVGGVLSHPASKPFAAQLCKARGVPAEIGAVYNSLAGDDVLAAGFARLLLWTDPKPLPQNDADAGWAYYQRNWRPGQPHPLRWPARYLRAVDFVLNRKAQP